MNTTILVLGLFFLPALLYILERAFCYGILILATPFILFTELMEEHGDKIIRVVKIQAMILIVTVLVFVFYPAAFNIFN